MQLKEVCYADPTIYSEDGKYYLSGTRDGTPAGFPMLVSNDLKTWRTIVESDNGNVLTKDQGSFGSSGFWAPQFYKINQDYFLAYTANEYVAIAQSNIITGPFVQPVIEQVDKSAKNIDPFVFKDESSGKYYLYHVRFSGGNFIYVAEFDPVTNKITTTPQQCFSNTQVWEATDAYPSNPIMEGPTVIERNGIYYMFYSANHYLSSDYAVGYATAKSPLGPWTKYDKNPILHGSMIGENGTGHGDLFFDMEDNPYYVFHAHNSLTQVHPRKTRIVGLVFTYNSLKGLEDVSVDFSSLIVPIHDTQEIVHISPVASGAKDGSSWNNTINLANAVRKVRANTSVDYQLWLQSGVYEVKSSMIFDYLNMYGGFAGNEEFLSERNWHTNQTILDGGETVSPLRNSTVNRPGGNSAAISCLLDGLIIQNGLNPSDENGGGMLINNGALIRNCIFRNNETRDYTHGGAVYCHSGSLILENSLFINNTSSGNGGAIQIGEGANVRMVNCTFANNKSLDIGGGIGVENTLSNSTMVNTVAHNNLSGDAVYNSYGQNGGDINGGGRIVSQYSAIESVSRKFNDGDDVNHQELTRALSPFFLLPSGIIGKSNNEEECAKIIYSSYELTEKSVCVDSGDDEVAQKMSCDLAGKNRKQGICVDRGAYEYVPNSSIEKMLSEGTIRTVISGNIVNVYGTAADDLLRVFNPHGVTVYMKKANGREEPVQIFLPPGIYILQANNDKSIKINI